MSTPVDLPHFPNGLAAYLNTSVFQAGILAWLILLVIFLFPTIFLARRTGRDGELAIIFVGFAVTGFAVALTWISSFFIVMLILLVALLYAQDVRDRSTGGGIES